VNDQQPLPKKETSYTPAIIAGILAVIVIAALIVITGKFVGNSDSRHLIFPEGATATATATSRNDAAPAKTATGQEHTAASATATATTVTPPPAPAVKKDAPPAVTSRATIATVKGNIEVELYGKDAPKTVANFEKLVKKKFYNGLKFHRVEPGFVIQGGDPNGDGSGGPGWSIKLEISPKLRHWKGALAMARSSDPDSAGSQFYITLAETPQLDDQYAVFGKVTKGMNVVEQIAIGDKIKSITLH
jgi:peptidyl-prolyl cis-trans isomerase B (cyclophilin B)